MTPPALEADECSPERALRSKSTAGNQPQPLMVMVPTGNLRSKGEEELVKPLLRKKAANQMGAAFDQDDTVWTSFACRLQNFTGAQNLGAFQDHDVHRRGESAPVEPL